MLTEANGVLGYHGCFRIFGIGDGAILDALAWNDFDSWRFAWGNRFSEFWSFGETCWGDQYAYRKTRESGEKPGAVYLLDAVSMTPELIAPGFDEFWSEEFVRCSHSPYDHLVVEAVRRLGPLRAADHFVYLPPLLLGGIESPENIATMDSRASMIAAGDIALGVDAMPDGAAVSGIDEWTDDAGRLRLRVRWK